MREHSFDNLIALCPNCHTRYHNGEIDRPSMRHYKENLALLNSRYGEYERRVFELAARPARAVTTPQVDVVFNLPFGSSILLMNAIRDGLVERDPTRSGGIEIMGIPVVEQYRLTPRGKEFVLRLASARDLEAKE